MFCHKQDYFEVEKIHYKALKIVYNSNECYEELLIRNNEVSIHQKQLHTLATEIYKSLTAVNPDFMKSYFPIKEIPYSSRNGSVLKYHQHVPLIMELIKFISVHVYCGMSFVKH